MDTSILPKQPQKDCSLELEKALKNSKILSSVFILLLQNRSVDITELSRYLSKSRAQMYLLCQRLMDMGIAGKVEKKSKFYLKKDIYSDECIATLKQDALLVINSE